MLNPALAIDYQSSRSSSCTDEDCFSPWNQNPDATWRQLTHISTQVMNASEWRQMNVCGPVQQQPHRPKAMVDDPHFMSNKDISNPNQNLRYQQRRSAVSYNEAIQYQHEIERHKKACFSCLPMDMEWASGHLTQASKFGMHDSRFRGQTGFLPKLQDEIEDYVPRPSQQNAEERHVWEPEPEDNQRRPRELQLIERLCPGKRKEDEMDIIWPLCLQSPKKTTISCGNNDWSQYMKTSEQCSISRDMSAWKAEDADHIKLDLTMSIGET
eukprot:Gb_25994 [translate_table: standard]